MIHAPSRVLGFADYLSHHPSDIRGHSGQTEQLWNDWFTVNSVARINAISENETTPLNLSKPVKLRPARDSVLRVENEQDERQAANAKELSRNEPIKSSESYVSVSKRKTTVANKLFKVSDQLNDRIMQTTASEVVDKINDSYSPSNYEAEKMLQKDIALVKSQEASKISRMPAPWRENFNSFSIDSLIFLYPDERLVIPAKLRSSIMSSVHYGHPGETQCYVTSPTYCRQRCTGGDKYRKTLPKMQPSR